MSESKEATLVGQDTPLKDRPLKEINPKDKYMSIPSIESHLHLLGNGWQASLDYRTIEKTYTFKNYHQVMAFANAVAYMAHQTEHYPVMKLRYNEVVMIYFTEELEGLSINDFILAARTDELYDPHI